MRKRTSLIKSTKNIIFISIGLITTVIFVTAAWITLSSQYSRSEKQIIEILDKTAHQEALYLQSQIQDASAEAKALALVIGKDDDIYIDSIIVYNEIINNSLEEVPTAFGMGYWFEPYVFNPYVEYYGPYYYKDESFNIVRTLEYSNSYYDYFDWDWYKISFDSDSTIAHSEPYYDPVLDTIFMTTTAKIIQDEIQVGVVSIDVTLREFTDHLYKIDQANETTSFLLSNEGYIIGDHTEKSDHLEKSIFALDNDELERVGKMILSENTSTSTYSSEETTYAWAPIGKTGLRLVLTYPKAELMQDTYRNMWINAIIFLIGITLLLVFVNYILHRRIDKPLKTIIHTHFSDNIKDNKIENIISKEEEKNLTAVLSKLMNDRQDTFLKLQESYEKLQIQTEEIQALYDESTRMNDQLHDLLDQVENGYITTVYSLSKAIEAKDEYTNGHCENVVKYSLAIAVEMNLSVDDFKTVEYAALLHDIGKIGVPSTILNKPGKLTDEEFDIIKKHPGIGYSILKDIDFLSRASDVVYQHHERIDGNGYPNGITGENIDDLAKIISIADAYDAMTSSRSYRLTPMSDEKALSIIRDCAGTYYDKELVDILENLINKGVI
jgi:putative nucleotidyltransferase with HDIG domain